MAAVCMREMGERTRDKIQGHIITASNPGVQDYADLTGPGA